MIAELLSFFRAGNSLGAYLPGIVHSTACRIGEHNRPSWEATRLHAPGCSTKSASKQVRVRHRSHSVSDGELVAALGQRLLGGDVNTE
jgi:hypothetical protein